MKTPEEIKEYKHQWYLKNRKKLIRRAAEWRKAQPDIKGKRKAEGAKYRQKYSEREKKKVRRWQVLNRERCNAKALRHYYRTYDKKRIAERNRRARERSPEKCRCRQITAKAVYSGALLKRPCQFCQNEKVHAHHPDYNQPFNVMWLCRKHHNAWHRLFLAREIGESS